MPTETNPHLEHIKAELETLEDTLDDYPVPGSAMHRLHALREYVSGLSVITPKVQGLVKLCQDCHEEEANSGLEVCGPCYGKRISR